MKDYQEAVVKMMQEVVNFFDENPQFEKDNSVLKMHVDKLRDILKKIAEYKIKQEFDNTGYTKNKNLAKQELANNLVNITSSICSFANDTGKNELYEEFNVPISKVGRKSDSDIVSYANTVLAESDKYKKELEPYQVTADELVNLTKETKAYSDILLIPAQEKKERAVSTDKIKKLITEGLQVMKRSIDFDMVHYKDSDADLYETYENLRDIDDSKTTALSIHGTVHDADDDCDGDCELEYVKVTVKFKAGHAWKDNVKMTSKKGNYQFDKLPEGMCTVTFEKNYYDTLVVNSEVHHNKATKLDVKLKKSV